MLLYLNSNNPVVACTISWNDPFKQGNAQFLRHHRSRWNERSVLLVLPVGRGDRPSLCFLGALLHRVLQEGLEVQVGQLVLDHPDENIDMWYRINSSSKSQQNISTNSILEVYIQFHNLFFLFGKLKKMMFYVLLLLQFIITSYLLYTSHLPLWIIIIH